MKKTLFIFLTILLFSPKLFADDRDLAYQSARDCYENLKGSTELQKRRDAWENCISQFKKVYVKFGRTNKGEEAKYSLGKLYEELAQNSKNRADWRKAVSEYESFARQYSRSALADDAYFRSAKIHWEEFGNKRYAVRNLSKVVKFYKNSDMAETAERYLEAVEKGTVPKDSAASPVKTSGIVKPRLIVIDPGHGGSDTGAIGPKGVKEKEVTLDIAKKLAAELRLKGMSVFLTRDSDKTLTLADRTKFANSKDADLFISIHANASVSKKQRGVQTYFLNNATDEASLRLAEQENKNLGRKASDLEKIIATMIQTESTEDSKELARAVHKNIVASLSKKYNGINDQHVRSALFYVLVGVKCPSILVETSYISNPKEEARLIDKSYQNLLADAISNGVKSFSSKQKDVAGNL